MCTANVFVLQILDPFFCHATTVIPKVVLVRCLSYGKDISDVTPNLLLIRQPENYWLVMQRIPLFHVLKIYMQITRIKNNINVNKYLSYRHPASGAFSFGIYGLFP